jgi:hypothetical protein
MPKKEPGDMPEGLSATEASELGGGMSERAARRPIPHARVLSIGEAVLLALVTLTLAWSGYAAAKWSTESSVKLAEASAIRTKANRADVEAGELRNFDSSTFEAWFAAYATGNQEAMALAQNRFRPEFETAFLAWRAQQPETNPNAPPGPTFMPEYQQPKLEEARALDEEADEAFASGAAAGERSDKYVRITIFLAGVLFLVGISAHFPLPGVRYGLIGVGMLTLIASIVQLALLPGPPP